MYDYVALRVEAEPCDENITDLLAAFLADVEFETFEPDETGLTAYVRKDRYSREAAAAALRDFPIPCRLELSEKEIEGEDWNSEWERNYFKPIDIDGKVVVRSSFHSDYPRNPIEIIIDPKMAFGTGHHATTAGMTRMLLKADLQGKRVIDMGTGTGILAILAKKLGAGETTGIDIDEFAVENARENGELNNVEAEWLAGDDRELAGLKPADVFLANINLNVITGNLEKYVASIKPGGIIFLSGFLQSDRDAIMAAAEANSLRLISESVDSGWQTMAFRLKEGAMEIGED